VRLKFNIEVETLDGSAPDPHQATQAIISRIESMQPVVWSDAALGREVAAYLYVRVIEDVPNEH